ncbi:MAG TPA: ferritin [Myxococcota bacterium]|nr:ferritin [Myxococcota bacterium]
MPRDALHESSSDLSPETREMHRALASLIEELEAVDWYAQRVDASHDAELRRVLAHNRDEEKEHACMTLEWIRRRDATFDALLRRLLFAPASASVGAAEHGDAGGNGRIDDEANGRAPAEPTLGIGTLRGAPREREEERS